MNAATFTPDSLVSPTLSQSGHECRFHIALPDRTAACGIGYLSGSLVDARTVPQRLRCRKPRCLREWQRLEAA